MVEITWILGLVSIVGIASVVYRSSLLTPIIGVLVRVVDVLTNIQILDLLR